MSNQIKAELWEITIAGSIMEQIHGWNQRISELFIPSQGIAINLGNDELHCFELSDKHKIDRYSKNTNAELIRSIMIDSDLIASLHQYINLRKKLTIECKKLVEK